MTMRPKATAQIVRNYQELFVNRRAYTMQSLRPHPETGRHYYFRPSQKGTDVPLMLTDSTIRQHLEGEITIGLYAINPSTQRCKWVAIDADYRNAMEHLLKLQYHNLAILIEDPRFYQCWAGCTKEMIRAALGCPIRVRSSA